MKHLKFIPAFSIRSLLLLFLVLYSSACSGPNEREASSDIVIENAEMRLVLGSDGTARSLIHKTSGQECLMKGVHIPAFSITQDMPYDNEIKLTYPAKRKTFGADSLYRDGDNLIVSFELTDYEAIISLNITDDYFGFTLEKMKYKIAAIGDKRKTRIDEFIFLQLPVKDRDHFGEWLNVLWDNDVAVNLLATDPYCKIDAEKRQGYKIFQAGGEREVKMEGVGAALITTDKSKLLDRIDRVERDFNLPLGVESRRSEEYKNSYYAVRGLISTQNVDEHIAYAKQAGLRQMIIYYPSFATSMGHFTWRPEYSNGMEDLKEVTRKIKEAGILPGFHIHYNKAQINDPYVTPVPDNRLNLRRIFTLRENIDQGTTTITVEENPAGCTLEDGRRMLKIGTEIVSYEAYTTEPPYQFIHCKRGALNTKPAKQKKSTILGLLDIDFWPIFARFNQNTDIQAEVAERIANIVEECGFEFIYYDGAEDVNRPYWYNVTKAQLEVFNALKTKSIFAEGAQKSHFGWHILTRGNAFDTFRPEDIKEATRKFPIEAIKMISNDFSSIDFGWIRYELPGEETIGVQPDMFEYVTSKAAAWNSIISIGGDLELIKNHPRTDDILEVTRRWEEVRVNDWLTEEQKLSLQDEEQEHILLIDEAGDFELQSYEQIYSITAENSAIRAFIFNRNNKVWVVYWHTFGEGNIQLPVNADRITLFEELGKEIPLHANKENILVPVGNRRYIQFDLSYEEVIDLFARANLVK
ncbi:MAG: hypothetical protein ABFS38_11870 [Bacteroidota bacterium]